MCCERRARSRFFVRFKLFYDYEPATLLPKYIFVVCVNCVARIWLVHHAVAQYEIVKTFLWWFFSVWYVTIFWGFNWNDVQWLPTNELSAKFLAILHY